MKKLLLVLVLGMTIFSCSKEEINPYKDCEVCFEQISEDDLDICWNEVGLPYMCTVTNIISEVEVECQEEIFEELEGGFNRRRQIYCIYNEDGNN